MKTTSKLNEILQKCKCGVYLSVNGYRDYYQTIQEGIDDINQSLSSSGSDFLSKEMTNKMIEHNKIISLQFYSDTPIGSYSIYHYDLEMALDKALDILNNFNK